jgi:hypothetical protein
MKTGTTLRQVAVADDLERSGPGRAHALHLLAVDVLDRLGVELGQGAHVGDEDRQHAGQRPETHGAHEDEAPDELVDTAEDVEDAPHDLAQEAEGHRVARAEEPDAQRRELPRKVPRKAMPMVWPMPT